jgi:hypothetical protein
MDNFDVKDNVIFEPYVSLEAASDLASRRRSSADSHKKQGEEKVRRPLLRAVAQAWSILIQDVEVGTGKFDIGKN